MMRTRRNLRHEGSESGLSERSVCLSVCVSMCVLVCVCVCRSEAGVSGEKGQVSSAADECRSYISSRPPQTPEQ